MSERFNKIPFAVHLLSAKSPEELFKGIPGLKRYFNHIPTEIKDLRDLPEHKLRCWNPVDLVKIIKYIVLLYDPESDLTFEYPDDYAARKDAAAKEAGFSRLKNGEWPEYRDGIGNEYGVADIIYFRNPQFIDWVIDYLKMRKNAVWTEIVFLREEIDALYRRRAKAIKDSDVRNDTMEIAKKRNTELQLKIKEFFANHGELKKVGEKLLFPITPENVFIELEIPSDIYQLRQVKDVS